MSKTTVNFANVRYPYDLLAISILNEAFSNIRSYYSGEGTEEEIEEGKKSLLWIKNMEGNFRHISAATNMSLEQFHQACIWKINQIRKEAFERRQVAKKD